MNTIKKIKSIERILIKRILQLRKQLKKFCRRKLNFNTYKRQLIKD